MTQDWTASLPHQQQLPVFFLWQDLPDVVVRKIMMSSPDLSDDPFDSYEQWDPYADSSQQPTQTNQLKLCQLPDWDSERPYDEDPPIDIHYSIEWEVTVNNRAVMPKDRLPHWGGQIKEAPHPPLGRCLPKELRSWMQNRHLLDTHLLGERYTILCVVLARRVIWDLIAGVTLLVKGITN